MLQLPPRRADFIVDRVCFGKYGGVNVELERRDNGLQPWRMPLRQPKRATTIANGVEVERGLALEIGQQADGGVVAVDEKSGPDLFAGGEKCHAFRRIRIR